MYLKMTPVSPTTTMTRNRSGDGHWSSAAVTRLRFSLSAIAHKPRLCSLRAPLHPQFTPHLCLPCAAVPSAVIQCRKRLLCSPCMIPHRRCPTTCHHHKQPRALHPASCAAFRTSHPLFLFCLIYSVSEIKVGFKNSPESPGLMWIGILIFVL